MTLPNIFILAKQTAISNPVLLAAYFILKGHKNRAIRGQAEHENGAKTGQKGHNNRQNHYLTQIKTGYSRVWLYYPSSIIMPLMKISSFLSILSRVQCHLKITEHRSPWQPYFWAKLASKWLQIHAHILHIRWKGQKSVLTRTKRTFLT